ncbi:MAG: NAD(P)H-binding protein [Flavobacterium sp.]|nr:NAD(P)H-binding protein [Flavobacterium sp.]
MKISIIGCGWLGFPLATDFLNSGFSVNGSTTSEEKLDLLSQNGINPFLIDLNTSTDFRSFLDGADIILVNVPPKASATNQLGYVDKMRTILSNIHVSGLKNVIFISSISVYADENQVVTERTPTSETTYARQLTEAENVFRADATLNTTILRLGGLIGGERHPIKSLSGRTNLQNPNAPVNLVQRDDCIKIIREIVSKKIWDETFNVVSPHHPSKVDYYSQKATDLNLALPQFDFSNPSIGKIVNSHKITDRLNFTFSAL